MNTSNAQIQIKVSLSEQLNNLLERRADNVGVPVTQYVKYLILKEIESAQYPTFRASKQVEDNTAEALKHYDEAVDASDFFSQLHES